MTFRSNARISSPKHAKFALFFERREYQVVLLSGCRQLLMSSICLAYFFEYCHFDDARYINLPIVLGSCIYFSNRLGHTVVYSTG
jgi:hypothetical protein